jgi:hypothetical protein
MEEKTKPPRIMHTEQNKIGEIAALCEEGAYKLLSDALWGGNPAISEDGSDGRVVREGFEKRCRNYLALLISSTKGEKIKIPLSWLSEALTYQLPCPNNNGKRISGSHPNNPKPFEEGHESESLKEKRPLTAA